MIDDRREVDLQVSDRPTVERVAADLGLKGEGKHYFCPGCQPTAAGTPEMVIKGGQFHCFRCDTQGDLVGLVKLARNCDLQAAIDWLGKEREQPRP
ncbi:MAG: hypothetical protein IH614_19645 [Desulfuromonadales bacterium]|nr:hypothetical protein [Desulfuromonadales bacterium]